MPNLSANVELIIIDGGSTDGTADIVKSYGSAISCFISEPDLGLYDAWNKGISRARGHWIAFLGADDILLPGAMSKYISLINEKEDIDQYDYICAQNEYVDKEGKLIKVIGAAPDWPKYRWRMNAAHVASLHNKKNLFETIGHYDLSFRICADYDLLLRKRNHLKYIFLPTTIAQMKAGGMSLSFEAIKEAYIIRRKNRALPFFINEINFIYNLLLFIRFKTMNNNRL